MVNGEAPAGGGSRTMTPGVPPRTPAAPDRHMFPRFFIPAPDSLWRTFTGLREHRLGAFWNLIWILWFVGDLLWLRPLPASWIAVTAAGGAALILLMTCAHIRPQHEVPGYGLGMVALACLLMPINRFGSGTAVIYGCVYLALQPRYGRMLLKVAPALAVWALETRLLDWPWQPIVWISVISLAAATGQYSMWASWRRHVELRLSHDEVRRLAASAERERIGRDLHDLLGHTLSMVALKSELAGRLIERDPSAAQREMADVARVSREALSQVRSAVSGIRAAALASEFASARLLLETAGVQMEYWSDGMDLPPTIETCLAMALREAVTNVQRHARANRVEVTVIAGPEQVVLRVRDDGRGGVIERGNGLTGMRERIAVCGGELWIESPRGKGTAIEVRLPLPPGRMAPAGIPQPAAPATVMPLAPPAAKRA